MLEKLGAFLMNPTIQASDTHGFNDSEDEDIEKTIWTTITHYLD